jgi:pyruvate/2-oxoglutarate dehydrogenase complex dihydrolipoamide acyltransferase (E2) component
MDKITVKAADPKRVAAWERHPEHPPKGECFVTGKEAHVVAATPYILRRLKKGLLILAAEEPAAPARPEEEPEAPVEAEEKQEGSEEPVSEEIDATDKARELAQELGVDLAEVAAAKPGERLGVRDVKRFAQKKTEDQEVTDGDTGP